MVVKRKMYGDSLLFGVIPENCAESRWEILCGCMKFALPKAALDLGDTFVHGQAEPIFGGY